MSLPVQPYPSHPVQWLTFGDGMVDSICLFRPEDRLKQNFVRELSLRMLSHFTREVYDRHMAPIAVGQRDGHGIQADVAGGVRRRCEYVMRVNTMPGPT